LRGVLSVVLLIGAVIAVVYVVGWLDSLRSNLPVVRQVAEVARSAIGSAIGTIVVFSVAIGVIYRMVPTETPSWSAIWRPALAVGFALAVLTGIFALITPRLIGSLRVYGAFVAVFAAMIWLSYVAQAILVGAAWVHRRSTADDQEVGAGQEVTASPGQ
jgi:uncharacterized BrkB/YihY/UPF0761 family membrane protein